MHDSTENEVLSIGIRDEVMSRLAHKGIAGHNLECFVSNEKILSSHKFFSFSTEEKHIGCFEVIFSVCNAFFQYFLRFVRKPDHSRAGPGQSNSVFVTCAIQECLASFERIELSLMCFQLIFNPTTVGCTHLEAGRYFVSFSPS